MRFRDALSDLEARQPTRMVPDLDRITAVAELLDHPERTYPSIHVTGTNGKTTTVRLIARILCAHGVAAGVYTSPHLESVTERLALCDDPISEEEFGDAYGHLRPVLEEVDVRGERVTYFEALTALAYLWFADKPVEAGVFEVGMGGTWDATNLIPARVAVLCSIGVDHPELGSTVREVATEKVGIVKKGATVVVSDPEADVMAALEPRAREMEATLLLAGDDYRVRARAPAVGGQQLGVRGIHGEYGPVLLSLFGSHQADNAAAAVVAAEAFLGRELDHDALGEALEGATSPGRLEVVSRHPLVVLDGAHNPEAAQALAAAVGEAFVWRRLHLVIGVLETKDLEGIVAALAPRADAGYACASSNPKARPPEEVARACRDAGVAASTYPSVDDALGAAEAAAGEDELILVTGSLYTVADARPRYVEG